MNGLNAVEVTLFAAVQQRHDYASVKQNRFHFPKPRRCFLFDPRSEMPEENFPSPMILRFFLRSWLASIMRKPSRTTCEGVQPNSRTRVASRFRERSSSLAWIAKRMTYCTTTCTVCDKSRERIDLDSRPYHETMLYYTL